MRSFRAMWPRRDRDSQLGEVRLLDGETGAQELCGEWADAGCVIEVEQRMALLTEARPQEVRANVVLVVGLLGEHGGDESACFCDLMGRKHVGNDQESLLAECSVHLAGDRRHAVESSRHRVTRQAVFRVGLPRIGAGSGSQFQAVAFTAAM